MERGPDCGDINITKRGPCQSEHP